MEHKKVNIAMGAQTGKLLKKGMDYMSGSTSENPETSCALAKYKGTPFVLTRTSSQYFDEDGQLAHEFYLEAIDKNSSIRKVKLKRITKGLRKQGEIKLDFPRINADLPVVIYEG